MTKVTFDGTYVKDAFSGRRIYRVDGDRIIDNFSGVTLYRIDGYVDDYKIIAFILMKCII